ncbi:hypothetical protein ACJQWK_04591 [Exserohilum turcicum]
MSHVAEDHSQKLASIRQRADSHQPRTCTSTSPRPRQPSEVDHLAPQAVISAYLRSSYNGDDADRPRRFSSAAEAYDAPSSSHHKPPGEMRQISGNFNAPTKIEVERQRSHRKRSRGMGKLKDAVKALVRA